MAAAKKGAAKKPSAAKGKLVKEFKLVEVKDGYELRTRLEPVPDLFKGLGAKTSFVVGAPAYPEWNARTVYNLVQNEANRRTSMGEKVSRNNSYVVLGLKPGKKKGTVIIEDGLMVGGPKPPTLFDDTSERRKAIKAEAAAIEAVSLSLLGFDTEDDAVEALNAAGDTSIVIDLADPDWLKVAQEKAAKLNGLNEPVKGLDAETRRRVFRHACHAFNIRKGTTPFR